MEKSVSFREGLCSRDGVSSITSPTLQSFSDLVICALCSYKLNCPKMLSCQHTFCLACLKTDAKVKESPTGSYECPTCKITASVTDFDKLPNNLHVETLLQILDPKNESQTLTRQLSVATTVTEKAVRIANGIRCSKCEVLLVTGVSSMRSPSPDMLEKPLKCRHCKFHFCPICWTVHMEQLKNQLQGLDAQLGLVRQRLQKKSEQFEGRVVDLQESISAYMASKIEKLKAREEKLLADVGKLVYPERTRLKDIKLKIRTLSKSLREDTDESQQLDELFLEKHNELSRLISSVSNWGEKKLKFDTTLGSIETIDDHGRKSSESDDPPEVEMRKRVFKVRLMWTRCPHPMGVAEAPWKDALVDDQLIYIAAADAKMVIGIDRRKGRVVRKIQQTAMEYPHSIAISSEKEEFAVSDKWANFIFIFNKEHVLLRVLGDKGESIGLLRSPEGLAIDGNVLYVCDTGNDRVQAFDWNTGDVLFQFGNLKREQISGDGEGRSKVVDLNAPTSIAIHQDTVLVLDSSASRIKVFNKEDMKLLAEFGKIGQDKGEFSHPDGIAVDHNGLIYVGDSGNARIQVFNKKLQFVRTIGTRGTGNGQFNWISGICLTENNELVVSDVKNHSVQILQ